MMLSGDEIKKYIEMGQIKIKPFRQEQLGPNSYDLRLHGELLVYEPKKLDMKKENPVKRITIPEEGLELEPGRLYLARTEEYCATDHFIPMLEGRSSIGRLGLFIHISAGFGNIGSSGYWTLELASVQPLVIYPHVPICQVFFLTMQGAKKLYPDKNKYKNSADIQPSLLWQEF